MKKIILFDLWGTLVETGVKSPTRQVKEILGIDLPFSEFVVRMERTMMTRKFASLREAFEAVAGEFGIQVSQEQMDELIGMWNKSWMLSKPYEEVEKVLEDLKKRYVLVLISNADSFSIDPVLERCGWKTLFAAKYLSFERGILKFERTFFENIFNDLKVRAEDCVLVGDSIESDMLPAHRMRMCSILVDRREGREFPLKVKSLGDIVPLLETL